jgi:signal transduction histidine kinase
MWRTQWLERVHFAGARMRIGVTFSVLAAVLFGGVGYLSARDARQQSEQDAAQALHQLAHRLAQRLDADMAARFWDIDQLAAVLDVMGRTPDHGQWRALLEQIRDSRKHYSWIGVAKADGRVLAATQGMLETADVSQRPWFAKGLVHASVHDVHEAKLLARLIPSPSGAEPLRFVDVSAPWRVQGQVVGVIGAHLSWAWADERRHEALASVAGREGVDIVLVNRDGGIELGPRAPTLHRAPTATVEQLLQAPRVMTWSDGRRYLTAASASEPMANYPGMGWVVVVRQPEAQALAAATALAQRLGWLSLLGVVSFGMLGWLLADRLTRPLRRVAAQAQALMPQGAGPVPTDEVRLLARSLAQLLADLKRREAELVSLNADLECRVQDRTAALEMANEDLRGFSRSVSHDIQGPLGAMAALLRQALKRDQGPVPPGLVRSVEQVAMECDRLRQLSAELLALAMVEQREMQPVPVDHAAMVQEVVAQLRQASAGAFPEVKVGPLPTLPGDPVLLRQAWANLLSNAVKFSSRALAPCIEVQAEVQGDSTVFCVADNGVGFDEAQGARLFGVFQRLHAPSQYPGTGVGLSIVRRVVQRHGGRVWATSPPGQGARFCFALPCASPRARAPAPPAPAMVEALDHEDALAHP